jgi:hypothetical protein
MRVPRQNEPLRSLIGRLALPQLGTTGYILLCSGIAIHFLTIYVGWRLGGWWSAGLSAMFPFAAQAYWILDIWQRTGIFLSFLTISCLAYALLWLAVACFRLR